MGESVIERPTFEKKMGESVSSSASLQVSVSFGRFESDSLSWEKWSSFSPNKYLEEVEKCSTPGSVAQKKAYFEAHYKKIAARKTEQLELEKLMESVPPSPREPSSKDPVKHTAVANGESGLSGGGTSAADVEPDVAGTDRSNSTTVEVEKEHVSVGVDCQGLVVEEAMEELNGTTENPETIDVETGNEELIGNEAKPEVTGGEAVLAEADISQNGSLEVVEEPFSKVDHKVKKAPLNKSKGPRLYSGNVSQKMTSSRKEQTSAGSKKKVVSPATRTSPVTKLPQLSTPKLSKSTMIPASISTTKKVSGSSLPRAKNTPGEKRGTMPASLHMSLSLDPRSSGPSLTTTRKSLIMESMGDKDIVRRAFKTFQNSYNELKSPNDGLSSWSKQVSYKGPVKEISTMTPQKENEGLRKSAEKTIQRGRPGITSNLVSSWSTRDSGVDKNGVTTVSSSTNVRHDARAEKWKEKPGEKSFVREAERPHSSSKTKEEALVKNTGQGLRSKASLAPVSYRGQGSAWTPSVKEKSKTVHRPTSKR
ncbi:uncharacterized protein [Coffea arabica]|uniref:Uncharacterized protein isoform X1 n=2 Tax=Coffea arabica TaxID=13443 RepID=A0ABM4W6K6_COFAR|nr:protein WVD2-like 7 isoform X1 [Coffea arabica]